MLDILVVDDEAGVRMGIVYPLSDAGHQVVEASDGAEALRLLEERVFDVVICDVRLPKIDGLTLLRRLHRQSPRTAVILMTAYARVSDAVQALREGAYDYVTKPFDTAQFPLAVVGRIDERLTLEQDLRRARAELGAGGDDANTIIGRSPIMVRLQERMDTIAQSDAPVLITGESGTGKELIAHSLHERSTRRRGPFVAVNCAALPDTLLEAELFGHERGAFTGAVKKREGRFKLADGGTLLLDEIGEISPSAQAKLLRVLQEGTIEPLGSSTSLHVDVRVISATHQHLKGRIAAGSFREDLYYRLNVLDLAIPPLRERPGDLPLLLGHFLSRFTPRGRPLPSITPRAFAHLARHPFPGNVRELAHAVQHAVVLSRGGEIDLEHLPADLLEGPAKDAPPGPFLPLAAAVRQFERAHLTAALSLAGNKRGHAAELLGISRKSLWEKLRSYNLPAPDKPDDPD